VSSSAATNEIAVVDCDDWLGLYVNGVLALQGHGRSRHADILAFGGEHAPYTVRLIFPQEAWLEEVLFVSGMPNDLADVIIGSEEAGRSELAAQ
jgi:hypothetical protein